MPLLQQYQQSIRIHGTLSDGEATWLQPNRDRHNFEAYATTLDIFLHPMTEYENFLARLKLLVAKRPDLIGVTLSNIFTMRLIGNKTHGDLAEIAMVEFINQYMYDFRSEHVGRIRYRKKDKEEDITITNEITNFGIPVSLKAYGAGDLQLSTNKNSNMFEVLEHHDQSGIDPSRIPDILNAPAFVNFEGTNVLALVYNEKR